MLCTGELHPDLPVCLKMSVVVETLKKMHMQLKALSSHLSKSEPLVLRWQAHNLLTQCACVEPPLGSERSPMQALVCLQAKLAVLAYS